jgi:hypothetical protein
MPIASALAVYSGVSNETWRLRRQIVDLVGLGFLDDANEVGVGNVAILQMETNALLVGVAIEMIDARRVEDEDRRLIPCTT